MRRYEIRRTGFGVGRGGDGRVRPPRRQGGTWARVVSVILLATAFAATAYSQTSPLARGEELFLENRMEEARPFLETALTQYPRNERIYLYLATVYESLGEYERAVAVLQRGTRYGDEFLDVMYFNIANNMFKQGKNVLAYETYTKAIEVDPGFTEAYLNRANTAVRLNRLAEAAEDYRLYLQLNPTSQQREQIEKVLAIIDEAVAEARRKALEAEQRRQEEEAKRKALLDQVLNSLENASKDTTNLSASTEEVDRVEEEADIVD